MKKSNFDRYLEEQMQDPAFAARFKRAGEAWNVACKSPPGGAALYRAKRTRTKRT
ncbi:MAG TPA: hypothetical protein VGL70_11095 [Candidatus Binatia bacterium]